MEDLLYEAESVRRFVGLNLTEALPDETTILNFRHLLERCGAIPPERFEAALLFGLGEKAADDSLDIGAGVVVAAPL